MTPTLQHDAKLGVDFVEVNDEPHHVEQFKNEYVRVYLATIAAGTKTLFHRHVQNTLYIVLEGGISGSEEPGKQKQRTGFGRSVGLLRKLAWGLRRIIFGTMYLPKSTLVMQYHRDFPLTHRVCAATANERPMKLLGIEIFRQAPHAEGLPRGIDGFVLEYEDREATVHRIRLAAGQATGPRHIGRPSLLVIVAGQGRLQGEAASTPTKQLGMGAVRWFGDSETLDLKNLDNAPLEALLVTLR
jgi:quercetin dioxygenase-like cupin family protein